MTTLKMARQRAADLNNESRLVTKQIESIAAASIRDRRPMDEAERAEILTLTERRDRLRDDAAANTVDLDAAEARNEAERRGEAVDDPDGQASVAALARAGIRANAGAWTGSSRLLQPKGRRFADLFGAQSLTTDGFASTEDFLRTLHEGRADSRLRATNMPVRAASTTGTVAVPSDGGFMVPTAIFADLFDQSLESQIVLPRADVRPMTTSEAKAPAWDDVDHSQNIYGGFSAAWIGETAAPDPQMGKLRLITLHARKLALFASCSNELVADGVGFEAQLGTAIASALGFFLDQAFLTGNGSNKPLGIFNSPATIAVARTTSGHVLYEDIVGMYARLLPASFGSARWVVSQSTLPDLLTLSMAIGTGGAAIPLVKESGGAFSMLGIEILVTEKVPALGTLGDVSLFDFKHYAVGLRAAFSIEKSSHVGFANDTSWYRGLIRVDGQPKLAAPIKPANGGATVSPFVTLAT